MDTGTYFLIGLLVYGAGPGAVAYMVYRFLKEARTDPSKPAAKFEDHHHPHHGTLA